MVLFEPVLIML